MPDAKPETASSVYRCAECGHGRNLTAWAVALIFGSLSAAGEVEDTGVWQDDLAEDSIECSKHPDATIEKSEDGQWCRWWVCPKCKNEKRPGWNKCTAPGLPPTPHTHAERHEGWRPVTDSGAGKLAERA